MESYANFSFYKFCHGYSNDARTLEKLGAFAPEIHSVLANLYVALQALCIVKHCMEELVVLLKKQADHPNQ